MFTGFVLNDVSITAGSRRFGRPLVGDRRERKEPLQIHYTVGRIGREAAAGELIIKNWEDSQARLL